MKIALEYSDKFDLQKATDDAVEGIRNIIETVGPRKPGSPEELAAQQIMRDEMKPYCDTVEIEEFPVHRQGFMGFIPFTVMCGVSSVFVNWFLSPLAAFLICLAAFVPLVLEFLMYKEFDDFLFPKQISHNMIATKKPKGETKQRFIMISHSDSQFEWTLNYLIGGLTAKLAVEVPAVVGLVIQTIYALVCLIIGDGVAASTIASPRTFILIFFIISIVFIPLEISFIFFQSRTKSVPGASDNLSGCYVNMGVVKMLQDAGIELESTELVSICSGSEEAGLRGAKAYARRHEKELKEIPTTVIALDTFRDLEDMAIYDRDLSGTLQHDWGAKHLIKNAAKNCGRDLSFASIYIGGCDAAAFTQRGIKATGFAAMNPDPPRYYHTRLDNVENLRPECMTVGLEIMTEAICMYDKHGLPKKED